MESLYTVSPSDGKALKHGDPEKHESAGSVVVEQLEDIHPALKHVKENKQH